MYLYQLLHAGSNIVKKTFRYTWLVLIIPLILLCICIYIDINIDHIEEMYILRWGCGGCGCGYVYGNVSSKILGAWKHAWIYSADIFGHACMNPSNMSFQRTLNPTLQPQLAKRLAKSLETRKGHYQLVDKSIQPKNILVDKSLINTCLKFFRRVVKASPSIGDESLQLNRYKPYLFSSFKFIRMCLYVMYIFFFIIYVYPYKYINKYIYIYYVCTPSPFLVWMGYEALSAFCIE